MLANGSRKEREEEQFSSRLVDRIGGDEHKNENTNLISRINLPFSKEKFHNHIVTGSLQIVANKELSTKGPNRARELIDFNEAKKKIMLGLKN